KACRREVLDGKFVPEGFMNRFSPAALGVRPHEFAEVEVVDRPRISGQSHYGLNRVFFVLRDLAALPFAMRGPARWIGRFRLLKWFSLAGAVLLAITDRWGRGEGALLLAMIAFALVSYACWLMRT